jgi:starvation-inducible DNA-binding protein
MLKTKNSLDAKIRQKVTDLLQDRLVDAIDLQTQLKQAHWNIKGPHFIGLHKLFDEINEDVEEYVDEIAERAVQLGAIVHGTARAVAKGSSLKEYPLDIVADHDHVNAVSDALAAFGKLVREAIDKADDAGDKDTADLLTDVSRGIDKWLWFVEAHTPTREPSSGNGKSHKNRTVLSI